MLTGLYINDNDLSNTLPTQLGQLVKLKGYNVLLHRNIEILKQGQVS